LEENGQTYIRNRKFLRKRNTDKFNNRQEFDKIFEQIRESNQEVQYQNDNNSKKKSPNNVTEVGDSSDRITDENVSQRRAGLKTATA